MAFSCPLSVLPARTTTGWLAALLLGVLCCPAAANAEAEVSLVDVDVHDPTSASIVFSVLAEDGSPIEGLTIDDVEVRIDDESVALEKTSVRALEDTKRPVAVVIVFPHARDHMEKWFGIRAATSTFVKAFRPIDRVGYVAYAAAPSASVLATGSEIETLASDIVALENTKDIEPDLFGALAPAIRMLEHAEGVDHRYLVVVSDVQGKYVGWATDTMNAYVETSTTAFETHGIRPLMIAYTPDGPTELEYAGWLEKLSRTGGTYTEAVAKEQLPGALAKVRGQIFVQYVLDVRIDRGDSESKPTEAEPREVTISVATGDEPLTDARLVSWPAEAR